MKNHPSFVLASTSPRRIELLSQAGLKVQVVSPNADETVRKGEAPRALVSRLASAKASSVADGLKHPRTEDAIILAADTIVVSPAGKILNKPTSPAEARRMLAQISGKTHTVLTGYCMIRVSRDGSRKKHSRICTTRVKMRKLSPKQIASYVETGEPSDKAGAYAAQGIGMSLVECVRGSYANVVGLPVSQVLMDLEQVFGIKLFSWMKKIDVESDG